jgi:hypothetical protein
MLVAAVSGRPIGTVAFQLPVEASARGEIGRLGVVPAYRGAGIGELLMKAAESALSLAGANAAEISIVAEFERLRMYYEGMGYEATRLRSFEGLPFDVLFMEKRRLRHPVAAGTEAHLIAERPNKLRILAARSSAKPRQNPGTSSCSGR